MSIAVIRFPGTNNENDMFRALSCIEGANPFMVSSRQGPDAVKGADAVVIPGGYSYGDYLRAGAVASVENIVEGIRGIAKDGKPVLGICNGFQILTEAGLLPGVLLHNATAHFVCKWTYLKVYDKPTMFTHGLEGAVIRMPIAHSEGNYYAPNEDIEGLKSGSRIPFRYCDAEGNSDELTNPNGARFNIAGVLNERGNVLGMMPHPERASRPVLGSTDGLGVLENFVRASREG